MSKTPLTAASVLALALGALSLNAQAAEPVGFYAGAGVGQSMVDEYFADDEDTGYQVFGGYQFNDYFGLEAAWTDFGDVKLTGGVSKLEADTLSLTAVGTLPFTDNFSAYAKAGFHSWDADVRAPEVGRASTDGTDPTYGLGLQYRFNDAFALRGEYSRFEMDDVDVDLAQIQVRFDF
ncbi:MAG: outer membrane beta-barrel protein [Gammaproteobacteria bacterium]|nr:outer membrane beta-barrel protein [Gammaproteobacteria bacterium]